MSHFLTVFRRELSAYFNSAIAYIFVIVFILFNNGLFMVQFFQSAKVDMRGFFNSLPYVLTIFIPAITMRLWAEEKKENTFELLLTFPMRPFELVLGKYLASLAFYLFTLATSLTIPLMMKMLGSFDPGPVIGGYLGSILIGALFLAIGIFVSGLCKDQIVAFILTMITAFAAFFIGTDYVASFVDGWTPGLGTFIRNYVGVVVHMTGFGRGIIDVKDFVYFAITILAFLFLNGLSLEDRLRPKAKTFFSTAALVCLAIVVTANWFLHDLPLGRFDVTQGKLYTISDASKKILAELKAPVQIKLYISPVDGMPTVFKTLERDIVDKLEELRIASDNKLRYRVMHMETLDEASGELRESLKEMGIVPFQVESIQRDEVGVKLIYSSLAVEYKEKPVEIIPRVIPQTIYDLEYQLVSRIYKLTFENRPKVALFAPLKKEALAEDLTQALTEEEKKESAGFADSYNTAVTLLRSNGYITNRVALTKDSAIPENTNLLLVFNPGVLTDRQRYEINKFLHGGGNVVVAAQPYEFTFKRESTGVEAEPAKLNLDINKLIEKWGVKVSQDVLMDESSQVISLSTGQRIGPFALEMPVKFPNQINVVDRAINKEAAVTQRIPGIAYLWGTALDLAQDVVRQQGLKATVLFTSTPRSWKMANSGSNLTMENTAPPESGVTGLFPLAVMIEGLFTNTFTGDKAPVWAEGDEAPDNKMGEAKPGKLIVIGCSKIFAEELIQNAGNLNFFANITDGLTLGTDLIQIRSKVSVVGDIGRLSSGQKIGYRFLTVLLVPIVLLIVAVGRIALRRKEKEFYMSAIEGKPEE